MVYVTVLTFASILQCLCLSFIQSAPVAQQELDSLKDSLQSQLRDQEKPTLINIPNSNGVEFSKTKTYSYTNINGAEHTKEQAEEKVSDPENHKVISDLIEKIEKSKPSPDAKTETVYRASIDIPEKGIHKEISNSDKIAQQESYNLKRNEDQEVKNNHMRPNVELETMKQTEFTPENLADYLFRTGETDEFQTLLSDLVESAEVSSEEAKEFENAVMEELLKLHQRAVNADNLETGYPQVFDEGSQSMFPLLYDVRLSSDAYPRYSYGIHPGRAENLLGMDNDINYLLNSPVTLDQMVNEWMKQAISSGDLKAEDPLGNIVDQVSRDKDPNNEDQLKTILGDMFAQTLMEYLTPAFEPADFETNKQKPAFIEGDKHKTPNSRLQDMSDSKETEKQTSRLATLEQNNDKEKLEEVRSKTDELEKELKL